MAKSINLITDSAKLDAEVVRLNKASNAVSDLVQLVIVSATFQAVAHGNTNHINAAVLAMGRGMRKPAVAQWLMAHAPVVMETDSKKSADAPFRFSRDRLAELMPDADAKKISVEEATDYAMGVADKHWTEHKEPPLVPDSWDVVDAMKKLIATAKSMQGKKVNIKHADILGRLADLLPEKEAELTGL